VALEESRRDHSLTGRYMRPHRSQASSHCALTPSAVDWHRRCVTAGYTPSRASRPPCARTPWATAAPSRAAAPSARTGELPG
jgi:hypothetical protein